MRQAEVSRAACAPAQQGRRRAASEGVSSASWRAWVVLGAQRLAVALLKMLSLLLPAAALPVTLPLVVAVAVVRAEAPRPPSASDAARR